MGIGQRLERGEGLRAHDEQRLRGIEIARGLREVRAVDVGHEAEIHVALAVVTQRLVGHHRAEVGAADADVDDVADALAGMAQPVPASDLLRECGHALQNRVHFRHDVDAVDDDLFAFGLAQSSVQNGALLGRVDLLAAEHGLDARTQAALLGKAQEQAQRLAVDAILRVVEIKPGSFHCKALAAPLILGEEPAQVHGADRLCVRLELLPHGKRAHGCAACSRVALFEAMRLSNSCQDLSKASAPSRWS